jgi:outer membrane protein assembly factor BamB
LTDWHEQPDQFHMGKVYIAATDNGDTWTVEFIACDPHDGESVWNVKGPMTFEEAMKAALAINAETDHEIVVMPRELY